MPDPREAVYDVLLAKKRRADEARAIAERNREHGQTFEEWNAANQRARAAAKTDHRTPKR